MTKSSRRVSKTSIRILKKQAKERAVAEKVATTARLFDTPSSGT